MERTWKVSENEHAIDSQRDFVIPRSAPLSYVRSVSIATE